MTLLKPEDNPTDLTEAEIHKEPIHPNLVWPPVNKTHKLCVYIKEQKNYVPGINKR